MPFLAECVTNKDKEAGAELYKLIRGRISNFCVSKALTLLQHSPVARYFCGLNLLKRLTPSQKCQEQQVQQRVHHQCRLSRLHQQQQVDQRLCRLAVVQWHYLRWCLTHYLFYRRRLCLYQCLMASIHNNRVHRHTQCQNRTTRRIRRFLRLPSTLPCVRLPPTPGSCPVAIIIRTMSSTSSPSSSIVKFVHCVVWPQPFWS